MGAGCNGVSLSSLSPTPLELVIHRYGGKSIRAIKYNKIFFRPFLALSALFNQNNGDRRQGPTFVLFGKVPGAKNNYNLTQLQMSKPKSGGAALDIDEGSYVATIKSVWDIGTQTVEAFKGGKGKKDDEDEDDAEKEVPQVIVEFELPERDVKGKTVLSSKDKPALLSKWLTNSAGSDRSNLYKLMKAVGIKTPATADLDELLGKSVTIQVGSTSSGKPKISGFAALTKGQKVGKTYAPLQSCYLDDTFDPEAFEAMPKFFQEKAVVSKEYEAVEAAQKKGKKR